MYERFTDRARIVMQLANQEAQRFNHEYVGTEHILLGLVKEGSGTAVNVLRNLGVDLHRVVVETEKIVHAGPDMVTTGKLPQTPRAKKVIEYSIEEARNLNHNYVGTEHLLLGLLREVAGVAAQVLMHLGLKLEAVREEVRNVLAEGIQPRERAADRPAADVVVTTGTPRTRPSGEEAARLLRMEEELGQAVVGQTEAVARLARALRKNRAGLADPRRPIGSFVFAGPPGVGKTLLARRLAAFLFGDEAACVPLDLAEFRDRRSARHFLAALRRQAAQTRPGQEPSPERLGGVILLERAEQAHAGVWNRLLPVLEAGTVRRPSGRAVDFTDAVLVVTSNLGGRPNTGFGLGKKDRGDYDAMTAAVRQELERSLPPEFLYRLDDLIAFRPLSAADLGAILGREVARIGDRAGLGLDLSEEAKDYLVGQCTLPGCGAWELRQAVARLLEAPLAEALLKGAFAGRATLHVRLAEAGREKRLEFVG